MGIYVFAISIFFISWAMIFGMCIDYRSAASIGIRIVAYFILNALYFNIDVLLPVGVG